MAGRLLARPDRRSGEDDNRGGRRRSGLRRPERSHRAADFDSTEERRTFGGVQVLEFNEQLALEAARLQDASIKNGSELSHRDATIAATARSTGDEYVVADGDFETEPLEDVIEVTNLHRADSP